MKTILLFFALAFAYSYIQAQNYTEQWILCDTPTSQFNISTDDCTLDSSGQILIVAELAASIGANSSVVLSKCSKSGQGLWQKSLPAHSSLNTNGAFSDNYYYTRSHVAADKEGNVFITFPHYENNDRNAIIAKYSPAGNLLWKKTFDGTAALDDDLPQKILIDKNGNATIAGITNFNNSEHGIFLVKYNAQGNELWRKYIRRTPGPNVHGKLLGCIVNDAVLDDAGNVYVTGDSYNSFDKKVQDLLVAKYTTTGDSAWEKILTSGQGDKYEESGIKIKFYKAGQAIYIGGSLIYVSQIQDFILKLKISDGSEIWRYSTNEHYLQAMDADNAGNVVFSGRCQCLQNSLNTSKVSSQGLLLWTQIIKDSRDLSGDPISVITDKFNNVFVQKFYVYHAGGQIFKYAPQGALLSRIDIDTTSSGAYNNFDWGTAPILLDNELNLYAVNSNYVGIKYGCVRKFTSSAAASPVSSNMLAKPETVKTLSIYPNPASAQAYLEFELNASAKVQIQLYRNEGYKVLELKDEMLIKGTHTLPLSVKNLSHGYYIILMTANGETYRVKFIKN